MILTEFKIINLRLTDRQGRQGKKDTLREHEITKIKRTKKKMQMGSLDAKKKVGA